MAQALEISPERVGNVLNVGQKQMTFALMHEPIQEILGGDLPPLIIHGSTINPTAGL